MGAVVGIDLGTTNSAVAVATDRGPVALADGVGSRIIPSVVSFPVHGGVLVGERANERRVSDPRNTVYSVKRLIGRPFDSDEVRLAIERFPFELARSASGGVEVVVGGRRHALSEISSFVLRETRRVAEQALGLACEQAVVTVPASFSELQRSATKTAGKIAGIEVLRTLNEPTAAALAYGVGRKSRERVAVFDLGGGTFDFTLLELSGDVFEVLGTAGDTFLGGEDIDRLVADELFERFVTMHGREPGADPAARECLRGAAEWAKCRLSFDESVDVAVDSVTPFALASGGGLRVRLERERLEAIARPVIERTLEVCTEALRLARVTRDEVDNVILVGGSTRMPLLRRLVGEYFGREPLLDVDPDLVVAKGAAVHAAALVAPLGRAMVTVPEDVTELDDVILLEHDDGAVDVPQETTLADSYTPAPRPIPLPPDPRDGATTTVPLDPIPTHVAVRVSLESNPFADDPPLLVDVTPLALRIETVGGFSEIVVPRNSAVPLEEARLFTTGKDFQESVHVRVCQGESRRIAENEVLGELELSGLRPAPRGEVLVRVTFRLEVDGSLSAQAVDVATGREQTITIRRVGAIDDEALAVLRERQEALLRESA